MQTSDQVGESSTDETQETSGAAQQNTNLAAAANEPIIITGGSIEIDLNKTIFPQVGSNQHKHKNAGKKLRRLVIAKKTSPNNPFMTVDLQDIDAGQCIITVEYSD